MSNLNESVRDGPSPLSPPCAALTNTLVLWSRTVGRCACAIVSDDLTRPPPGTARDESVVRCLPGLASEDLEAVRL